MRVPIPSVSLQTPQSPGFSAPNVVPQQSAVGDQLQQLGQGVQTLGGGLSRVANVMQDTYNDAKIAQGRNRFADAIREQMSAPGTGYLYAMGEAATSRRKEVFDAIKQSAEKIASGLDSEIQKQAFEVAKSQMLADAEADADRHESKQLLAFKQGQLSARSESLLNETADSIGSPNDYQAKKMALLATVDELAEMQGQGPEQRKQSQLQATTKLHEQVIRNLIAEDRSSEAAQYLSQNEREIDPETRARVASLTRKASVDTIAWNYANELHASNATRAEKLAAINQSVRTGRMDGEAAKKTLQLMEHLENEDWQSAQRERRQVGAELKQMFAQDENLSVETLPPEVIDRLDRTGTRSDAYKIHRQVREARIADMLSDGKMDSLTLSRDVRSMNDFSRLIKQLEDRKPYGKDAQTPEGKQRLERIQKQIDSLSAQLEGMATRPRTYLTDGDLPLEAPNKDGKTAAPPMINMQDFARQIREALYPGAPR